MISRQGWLALTRMRLPMACAGFPQYARAALAEFADESVKIRLRSGGLSSASLQLANELPENEPLLAYVGGARTREGGDAKFQGIFDANPRAHSKAVP